MYLADSEIKEKLEELNFECHDTDHPFVPENQIQPCSIDLRLDKFFWEPEKSKTIDLRKRKLLEFSPRKYWKKIHLKNHEYITIKPGEIVNGRIYEKFTIPSNCAGKISGRSSFARMGLAIHATGDFLNPSYRGHMPLQLINQGKNSIRIYPYIPICQLILIKLTSEANKQYGDEELQSKYSDDDGGPSYWWRDKRIKNLQDTFQQTDVALKTQEDILPKIGVEEPEIIERFEKFIKKKSPDEIGNSEKLLFDFFKKEEKNENIENFLLRGAQVIFVLNCTVSIPLSINKTFTTGSYIVFGLNIITTILFIFSLMFKRRYFLTTKEAKKKDIY